MLPGCGARSFSCSTARVFVGEAMWSAIVPLVPAFAHRFALSPLQSGVLLASASVAILIVSIPAGMLGERLGARRVTLAAMAVLAVADAGQGLAGTYWELLAARAALRRRLRRALDDRPRLAQRGDR